MCSSAIFVSRFLLVSANLLSALLSLLVVEMPSTHRAQHVPILDLDASDEDFNLLFRDMGTLSLHRRGIVPGTSVDLPRFRGADLEAFRLVQLRGVRNSSSTLSSEPRLRDLALGGLAPCMGLKFGRPCSLAHRING